MSVDISAYVRVTTRLEAKTPGKQILTTLPEISGRDFDFRYVTFISVRDVLNVGFSARVRSECRVSARDVLVEGFLGFFRVFFRFFF